MFVLATLAILLACTTALFAVLWRRERAYRIRCQADSRMWADLLKDVARIRCDMEPLAEWIAEHRQT